MAKREWDALLIVLDRNKSNDTILAEIKETLNTISASGTVFSIISSGVDGIIILSYKDVL